MQYFIKRDLSEFGPYTLSDLERYIVSGNILLTDLARGQDATEWVPVSQFVGTIPAPVPATVVPTPVLATIYPDPPSLHWGLVLLFAVITCGLFGWVWALVEGSFIKKIDPASKALLYYGIAIALFVVAIPTNYTAAARSLASLLDIAGIVLWVIASFNAKASLEGHYNRVEAIALVLSPVMTFFFSVYYFQYHFTKITELKKVRGLGRV